MERPFRLVLMSGLGADHRLLDPQRQAFPDLLVPAWIRPVEQESLSQYAARLAESIPRDRPLILGGVSLGGMLACEMATLVRPAAVVLIASCRAPQSLCGLVRVLRPLAAVCPQWAFRGSQQAAPAFLGRLSRGRTDRGKLLLDMYRRSDPAFLQWACRAVLHWRPSPVEGVRVFHIHGGRDRLIPASRVWADRYVPRAGHLVNMTHAEEVNAFLRQVVQQVIQAGS